MLIKGATGQNSDINGIFKVVEWPDNEPPIYCRADGSDCWLFVNHGGEWAVGNKKDMDTRKIGLSACLAYSVEQAQGRLPYEVGTAWIVSPRLDQQQLQVLHCKDPEAAIAEVHVHVCMHIQTRTRIECRMTQYLCMHEPSPTYICHP